MQYSGADSGFKKEGAQWLRGLAPNTFLANLGDFLKNLGQKGVPPSGSAPGSSMPTIFYKLLSLFKNIFNIPRFAD